VTVHEGFLERLTSVAWGGVELTFVDLSSGMASGEFGGFFQRTELEVPWQRHAKTITGELSGYADDLSQLTPGLMGINSVTRGSGDGGGAFVGNGLRQGPFYNLSTDELLTAADRPFLGYALANAGAFAPVRVAAVGVYDHYTTSWTVTVTGNAGTWSVAAAGFVFEVVTDGSKTALDVAIEVESTFNAGCIPAQLTRSGAVLTMHQAVDGIGTFGSFSPISGDPGSWNTPTTVPTMITAPGVGLVPGWLHGETVT